MLCVDTFSGEGLYVFPEILLKDMPPLPLSKTKRLKKLTAYCGETGTCPDPTME